MTTLQYNHADYERLTTLNQAIQKFDDSNAQAVLDNEFCALFQTHDVGNVFGIGLLHRHFDMSRDEILVEHGATSTPWTLPPNPSNFMDGSIVPRSWHFPTDSITPRAYEFGFQQHSDSKQTSPDPLSHREFIADLHQLLKRYNLTDILGLVALTSDYLPVGKRDFLKCERTFGRANVVFDVGAAALYEKENRTAMWLFGKDVRGGQEQMFCLSGCFCRRGGGP